MTCVTDWKVKSPNVIVMKGAPTDNNATLFAQGYNGVLQPHFDTGEYMKVGEPAGTWDPSTAQTTFKQQFTAHKNINAVVSRTTTTRTRMIRCLKTQGLKPYTFPTTGQDAS